MVTATYKKKKYKCRVTVKTKKRTEPATDHSALNSSDVTLYYLSEEYKDYITYDKSHLREYRFRVSGTKKEVREIRAKGSVLDVKNMTHLVSMYDAIKKLNKLLLGEWEIHGRDGGVLRELDRVIIPLVLYVYQMGYKAIIFARLEEAKEETDQARRWIDLIQKHG